MKEERRKFYWLAATLFLVLSGVVFKNAVLSYDTNIAHPFLAEKAAALFNNQNPSNKLSAEQVNWIIQGAKEEDMAPRWMNHFYNPNTGLGLSPFMPANIWVSSGLGQTSHPPGDQSWLTAISAYASGDKKRAFIALGHVLHLIEDMAVPAHTRLDAHPEGDPYEEWVKFNIGANRQTANLIKIDNLEQAFNSLAEYSNKYFLSKDTIKIVKNTKEEIINNKIYLIIADDKGLIFKLIEKRFAAGKISYIFDDAVNSDYYFLLAPKAIGYGAGVIDLFIKKAEAEKNKKPTLLDKIKQTATKAGQAVSNGVSGLVGKYKSIVTDYSYKIAGVSDNAADATTSETQASTNNVGQVLSAHETGQENNQPVPPPTTNSPQPEGVKEAQNQPRIEEKKILPAASPEVTDGAQPASPKEEVVNSPALPSLEEETQEEESLTPVAKEEENKEINLETSAEASADSEMARPKRKGAPDILPPETAIAAAPISVSSSTAAEFVFSSSEVGSIFECDLDAGGWQACASPKNLSLLADGGHIFKVRAIDSVRNADQTPAERSWAVDTTPPSVIINGNPAIYASSTSASFSFSADEVAQYFYCDLDENGWPECSSPASYESLAEGGHNFQVKAIDLAGNETATSTKFNWTISLSASSASIASGPPDAASSTAANFQLTSNDNNAAFQCRLDASVWQNCSASTTVSNLAEGFHIFEARAADQAGNTGSSTQKTWLIDLTSPASTVASLPASYQATGFAVSWSGADSDAAGATSTASGVASFDVQYKIGAGEWLDWVSATTSTSTVFSLAVDSGQTVYFRSRARDLAGNQEDWPTEADTIAEIISKHLVISEVQVGGADTDDEFIEIYNPADAAVDLSGYSIQYRGGGAQNFYASNKNFLAGSTIKSKGYFLIAAEEYTGGAAASLVYGGFVMAASGGTIFLVDNHTLLTNGTATSSAVIDRLAYGSGQYLFPEGTAYATAPAAGQSLERKALATSTSESMAAGGEHENSGNGYDSGNNSADFVLRAVPEPRGSYAYDIIRDDVDTPTNFGRDYMFTDFKPASSAISGVAIKTTTSRAAGSFSVTLCKGAITQDNYTAKVNCGIDILVAQKSCNITNNWIFNAWQNCNFDNPTALVPNDDYYLIVSGNTWVGTSYSSTNYGVKVACGFNSGGGSPYCFPAQFWPFMTLRTYSND